MPSGNPYAAALMDCSDASGDSQTCASSSFVVPAALHTPGYKNWEGCSQLKHYQASHVPAVMMSLLECAAVHKHDNGSGIN